MAQGPSTASVFTVLRRFAHTRGAVEKCDWCGVRLAPEHRHLVETEKRKIICACDPCALRFEAVVDGRFKLIPREIRRLEEFRLDDALWEDLALPINLAFLFHSTPAQRVIALYPGPAGVTESLLSLSAWEGLRAANPALGRMEPDVEALLVNRVGQAREYHIAPIDVCFELVGLIRIHWRGLSGGTEVWQEIARFHERLRERSKPEPASHA